MSTFSSPSMTPTVVSDICIVGDGIIAKTAALGLAQAGQRVILLAPPSNSEMQRTTDLASNLSVGWDVRVYALNHTAQTLLAHLKVWDALDVSRISPVDAMCIKGEDGQSDQNNQNKFNLYRGTLSFDAYSAHVKTLAWIVEDRNINHGLDTALKFCPNIQRVYGHTASLKSDDTFATIQLANGEILRASLVIGADGGHSWVRNQCQIGMDYHSYRQRAIVTNFTCEKPHHGVAHQWFTGANGIVALLPLPGQRVSLVWSAPDALAANILRESATDCAMRIHPLCHDILGDLQPIQPEIMKAFPLSLMRPHAMIAPRIALLGDAAHVIHPLAGHGMNLGFADVAALLKIIAAREAHRDCGDARILARYARARKEDVLLMQLTTDGVARLFGTNSEPVHILRNAGLNLLNQLPILKRRLISHAIGKSW